MEKNKTPKGEHKKKEPRERKKNWREYTVTVEEIQDFLMERMQLRHNVVTGRTEYRPTPSIARASSSGSRRPRWSGWASTTASSRRRGWRTSW